MFKKKNRKIPTYNKIKTHVKKIHKLADKITSKSSALHNWYTFDDVTYHLITEDRLKVIKRMELVKMLRDLNYERNGKLSRLEVVAFLDEVINVEDNDVWNEYPYISERYDIAENRINNQAVLYINSRKSYNLNEYFEDSELILWKYRDKVKLQRKLEEQKVTEEELNILMKFNRLDLQEGSDGEIRLIAI